MKQGAMKNELCRFPSRLGGDSRVRTGDLLLARQAFSQLNYIPVLHDSSVLSRVVFIPSTSENVSRYLGSGGGT